MFPFWDLVIAPVLEAVGAKRVVEIGALRGETTTLMLERLGPDAELHVIDPVPEFDPAEHERALPGPLRLPPGPQPQRASAPARRWTPRSSTATTTGTPSTTSSGCSRDAAREARRAAAGADPARRAAGRTAGATSTTRRSTIPEEFRQPYAQRGHATRAAKRLLPRRRPEPDHVQRRQRGRPAQRRHDRARRLHRRARPAAAPGRAPDLLRARASSSNERTARPTDPSSRAFLDWLESAEGAARAARARASTIRLRGDGLPAQRRTSDRERAARASARAATSSSLKGALLDEHYLENELRIEYLAACVERERASPDADRCATRPVTGQASSAALAAGATGSARRATTATRRTYFPYTDDGPGPPRPPRALPRRRSAPSGVAGDLVECGTGRGGGAIFMRGLPRGARAARSPRCGSPTASGPRPTVDRHASADGVADLLRRPEQRARRLRALRPARRPGALPAGRARRHAGRRADRGDRAAAHRRRARRERSSDVLDALYDRVAIGGFVIVDDYGRRRVREAVERFRADGGIAEPLERIDWSRRVLAQDAEAGAATDRRALGVGSSRPARRSHPARPTATASDLSVVVVFYNMRREAARTLHSLSARTSRASTTSTTR